MSLHTSRRGGTVIVRAEGRIDSRNAGEFEACLPAADDARSNILIDLQDVDYMSSAGLRVLVIVTKASRVRGGRVVLAAPKPAILKTLKTSGFDQFLEIHA